MHTLFNNISNSANDFVFPQMTKETQQYLIAELFEQLLIFDCITIPTNRVNFQLTFLIDSLGLNNVQELLNQNLIKFMVWSPILITSDGTQRPNGTIDHSTIFGQPPLGAGTLSEQDLDHSNNIEVALNRFGLHQDRFNTFKKIALENYVELDGMKYSTESADFVISAYESGNLTNLGLPNSREPDQMTLVERKQLLKLGSKVLETAVLSQFNLKSFNNYEHFKICETNLENIGQAYNVVNNTSNILTINNIPDLKSLYLTGKIPFNSVFELRNGGNAKYYRNWINTVGESSDAFEVTSEYLKEMNGSNKFVNSTEGKFVRTTSVFGLGTALTAILNPAAGVAAGLALGLLDTFVLENIFQGKNPSMFIDDIEREIRQNEN